MLSRLLLLCFIFCSCAGQRMVQTSLYFGLSKPNGDSVRAKEWNDFKETQVLKVFKEGSTVVSVMGNWYDTASHQLISEPTYVVVYYYKYSPKISRQIDSLRTRYKTLFQQQSVLRVDQKVKGSF